MFELVLGRWRMTASRSTLEATGMELNALLVLARLARLDDCAECLRAARAARWPREMTISGHAARGERRRGNRDDENGRVGRQQHAIAVVDDAALGGMTA